MLALEQNSSVKKETSHKEIAMQAVEVTQIVPQDEAADKPQAPVQEQAVKEDESLSILRQIRNISAFCDCV